MSAAAPKAFRFRGFLTYPVEVPSGLQRARARVSEYPKVVTADQLLFAVEKVILSQ